MLAGSQTMSAAIGSAEQAVTQGAFKLPAGTTAEQVSAMIALSYGITYIWGTVGIILICKYLPRWWGVDARRPPRSKYEEEHGVQNVDDAGLTGYRPFGLRAYASRTRSAAGKTIARVPRRESRVPDRQRACAATSSLGADARPRAAEGRRRSRSAAALGDSPTTWA